MSFYMRIILFCFTVFYNYSGADYSLQEVYFDEEKLLKNIEGSKLLNIESLEPFLFLINIFNNFTGITKSEYIFRNIFSYHTSGTNN